MRITSLRVEGLRILQHLHIEPCAAVNFVVGSNGAGKTSLLEAIYLAGRGRTFRHADSGPMIRDGCEGTTVLIEMFDEVKQRRSILGLRRERKTLVCRLDGQDLKKRSDLAEALPVQWIGSQPQLLLSLGPEVRRRFIDMGLFHVEQSYLPILSEFLRILRQRNAAIRQNAGRESVQSWNLSLSRSSESVNKFREEFIDSLMKGTQSLLSNWETGFEMTYRYRPGWSGSETLLEQLERKFEVDLRQGYTGRGPQRAELELIADGGLAERKLSRGQQKLLVLAMNLALVDLLVKTNKKLPVVLVDDLAAELDRENRERVMLELGQRGIQGFLTKIEPNALVAPRGVATRTFHVEHGAIVA